MFFRKKEKTLEPEIIIPNHIGIIMDGNGRWAKKRGLPRSAGHKAGAKTFKTIAKYANKIGVQALTVYAFSSENWKRPQEEVEYIMGLFRDYLKDAVNYIDENIKTRFIGDKSVLPSDIVSLMEEDERLSENATGMTLNIAINYGGRQEIINAAKELIKEGIDPDALTEDEFSKHLYTGEFGECDLIIRPSGELRLSNFLVWQSAYSEFVFMDVLWPDFKESDLDNAILEYSKRNRRFGGL
jgi:undecaprenyl diphosphate synthase